MAGFLRSLFPRRRGNVWPRVVGFTIFFWMLIVFGFRQKADSQFGEHLDRNHIEKLRDTNSHDSYRGRAHHAKRVHDESIQQFPHDEDIAKEFMAALSRKTTTRETRKVKKASVRPKKASVRAKKASVKTKKASVKSKKTSVKAKKTGKLRVVKKGSIVAKAQSAKGMLDVLPKGGFKKNDQKADSSKIVLQTTRNATMITKFQPPQSIFGMREIGVMGEPEIMPEILPRNIKEIFDDGWKKNVFNQYLSDLISFHRTLPDFRSDYCRKVEETYSRELPSTSIIIIFHNEAWSTLLRTVHSVLDRSPEHLIAEIILVDDASTLDHLKYPLDEYVKAYPKVKVLRAPHRQGLIQARLRGAAVAIGKTMTFLDSHVECTKGWLEPLLDRVAKNPTNVPCPVIGVIDDKTFGVSSVSPELMEVGGFDWTLTFRWDKINEREKKRKKDPSEPTQSPTMAGGLFSIDKAFFEKLGKYDPDFNIWGGENLELSFKTWMCGGTVEIIPCSHVAHVFRESSPYSWGKDPNVLYKNLVRVAEVWMDDHAKYYYDRTGFRKGQFGDISKRVKLRKDLKCKSFKWYMDNVYPELKIPGDAIAYGEIRNVGYGNKMCVESPDSKELPAKLSSCHLRGGHQFWVYDKGQICRDSHCIHYDGSSVVVKLQNADMKRQHIWSFNITTRQLRHEISGKCLEMTSAFQLVMENCNASSQGQKWKLQRLRPERLVNSRKGS